MRVWTFSAHCTPHQCTIVDQVAYKYVNSQFAHRKLFSRLYMVVKNDPKLHPGYTVKYCGTEKKIKNSTFVQSRHNKRVKPFTQ